MRVESLLYERRKCFGSDIKKRNFLHESQHQQRQLQAHHNVDNNNYIINRHNIKSKTSYK
jgi:hypothetical protein